MNKYDIIFESAESQNPVLNSYFFDGMDNPIPFFPQFNTINIIIGANNSGKSRFMRFLMGQENFEGVKNIGVLKKVVESYNEKINLFNRDIINVYVEAANKGNYGTTPQKSSLFYSNRLTLISIDQLDSDAIQATVANNKKNLKNLAGQRDLKKELIKDVFISDFEFEKNFFKKYSFPKRYFIPTLRTAHSLFESSAGNYKKIEEDIYLETLNKYYQLNKLKVEVFTGIHLHKQILNTRNAKRSIRESFEKFEKFISKYFFAGKQIDIVAEFNKDESLQGFNHSEIISVHIEGEKNTRDLYELGDGIQAIIILMYKIFTAENNSLIFIDEPELNLHPGMQRLFLDQICNNDDLRQKNLSYIIATHSNHFLDLTLQRDNISIYSFSPKALKLDEKQFVIRNVNNGDNSVLQHLGVNNSSVFLANCSIWVEGISDRNYLKAFLKSYVKYLDKVLREDIDFAFFEYAGSNIDHYVFEDELEKEESDIIISGINALALNNRIFLLADSDQVKKTTKKGKRLKRLEEDTGKHCTVKILWDIREIENLIHNEVWGNVIIHFCNKKLLESNKEEIVGKIHDAFQKIKYTNYETQYIGHFLEAISLEVGNIGGVRIINRSIYESSGDGVFGTFIPKRELSEIILEADFPWSVFAKNPKIVELTEEVYKFIVPSSS